MYGTLTGHVTVSRADEYIPRNIKSVNEMSGVNMWSACFNTMYGSDIAAPHPYRTPHRLILFFFQMEGLDCNLYYPDCEDMALYHQRLDTEAGIPGYITMCSYTTAEGRPHATLEWVRDADRETDKAKY